MLQSFLAPITALMLLTSVSSWATTAAANNQCAPVSSETVSSWNRRLGTDPVQFLIQNLQSLHVELKDASSPQSRTRQMKALGRFFDIETWSKHVANARSQSHRLSGSEELLMQYLFTAWMRERYLGLLSRTVHKEELSEVKRRPFRLARVVRQRVHSYPAEPRVVEIQEYKCSDQWDRRAYDCSSTLFTLGVQASPYLLCSANVSKQNHRFRYLVRKDQKGLRILDVVRGDYHVYKDAYKDYYAYRRKWPLDQLKAFLQRVTFTSTAGLSPEGQSDFGLFTNLLKDSKPTQNSQKRLPASDANKR